MAMEDHIWSEISGESFARGFGVKDLRLVLKNMPKQSLTSIQSEWRIQLLKKEWKSIMGIHAASSKPAHWLDDKLEIHVRNGSASQELKLKTADLKNKIRQLMGESPEKIVIHIVLES